MFSLAVVVYVAQLTGRRPAVLDFNSRTAVDEVFDLGIRRFGDLCPCYVFDERGSLWYDRRVEELADDGSLGRKAHGRSILLAGYFQSWKYTRGVERRLRRHFAFRPEVRRFADEFLTGARPPGWLEGGYVRVGVHVRRGDVLDADKVNFGYTTPDARYFARAMRHFVDRFARVQFVVASNDVGWCRQNLENLASTTLRHRVNVTVVPPRGSPGQDLAVLASCRHVIMSTGSYGWWAAWLAGGTTVYYVDWPRNASGLAIHFRRADFFPPHWIGMT